MKGKNLEYIQKEVHRIRKERNFHMEPLQIFSMLVEEVGEISSELKRTWSKNYRNFSKDNLKDELGDALVCLIALANQYDIDLAEALEDKFVKKDEGRVRE